MLNCADAIAYMQDRLAEIERKHDVRFWPDNCHVVSGRPFEEICRLAREIEADLIVLPTRGHSGLKRVFWEVRLSVSFAMRPVQFWFLAAPSTRRRFRIAQVTE